VGVATQDEILEKRFKGKPEYVINYFNFVAQELRAIMASLGIKRLEDMVGRTDLLERNENVFSCKTDKVDFSKILYKPKVAKSVITHCAIKQDHAIDKILDIKLIELAQKAIKDSKPVKIELAIKNVNRTTGAMLSGEVCRIHGEEGLPADTIQCKFKGIAGQSFGAFLAKGITFELEGMANDYVGKGISGATIIAYPDKLTEYKPEENMIIGNTAFYGAISGQAYIRGMAGERFCIRNSGLFAVVEGVGDHGCEYMTGGRVIVLGRTGRNFAAGMSGGIAYIFDPDNKFEGKYNKEMVQIEKVASEDELTINDLLGNHYKYTASPVAKKILANFKNNMKKFVKVMPLEYKRILENTKITAKENASEVSDG
jgi:glutamate synthase domain-containing protein 3